MIRKKLVALILAGLFGPAFAESETPECPAEVRGVAVSKVNVAGGLGFTFTTPRKAELGAFRALVREAAAIIEHHTKISALHPDADVMPTSTGEGLVPAIDITVRDVTNGAYVVVRPEDPGHLQRVRDGAKNFEVFWSTHECVAVPRTAKAPRRAAARR